MFAWTSRPVDGDPDSVKPKASALSTRTLTNSGEREHLSGRPSGAALLIIELGAIAIVIAVFAQPTQAVAAAVIVVALCALAQGRSVARSTVEEVRTFMQLLTGQIAEDRKLPAHSQRRSSHAQPRRSRPSGKSADSQAPQRPRSCGSKSRSK